LARTLGRHHHEFETVIDNLQAIFNGNTGHVCPAASAANKYEEPEILAVDVLIRKHRP